MTPNIGPIDINVTTDAASALFNKIGPAILVTHSHSGGMGWVTAIKNQNVKAIVSYEPGSGFVFPEGEVPPPIPMTGGTMAAVRFPCRSLCSLRKFRSLFTMAIIFLQHNQTILAQMDGGHEWLMARLWRDAVNKHGGDVTVVHLPEIGIKGNTHFPFSDLNNIQVADLMSKFLKEKGSGLK